MKVELKQYKNKTGIYIITSNVNSKYYIGSAINIYNRFKDHTKRLKNNTHKNQLLQNHYNKYGMVFKFDGLCECKKEYLIKFEQYYLDLLKPYDRDVGFNINKVANSMLGFKHTEETKKNLSNKRLGIKKSESTKRCMSESKKGNNHPRKKLTEKQVIKIREKYKFRKVTCKMLAVKYNVCEHTILYIIQKRTWNHI